MVMGSTIPPRLGNQGQEIKMETCEITISQRSIDIFSDRSSYTWSVRPDGLYADECVGNPHQGTCTNAGKAIFAALVAAQSEKYDVAKLCYLGRDHKVIDVLLDTTQAATHERAQAIADQIFGSK